MFSRIPVTRAGAGFSTLGLWARDLEAQVKTTGEIGLIAPLGRGPAEGSVPLPEGVRLQLYEDLRNDDLRRLVSGFDVAQVNGGAPRWESRGERRLAQAARAEGRCLILGLSSNRAKSAVLNAQSSGWPRRLKAAYRARSILNTQEELARTADGVLIVGHGLLDLVRRCNDNVHVGIASWINEDDVIGISQLRRKLSEAADEPRIRLCVATRLEKMKGVHLAVQALGILRDQFGPRTPSLVIMGTGAERDALEEMVLRLALSDLVEFAGTFDYPEPFFSEIRRYDVMLLTNLSDEQPRLIFDAIAQGVLPICPDSPPYRELEVDDQILFRSGDAESLARTIARFIDRSEIAAMSLKVRALADRYTIENMHRLRAEWITRTLQARRTAVPHWG
jgi:glycosyltransferase involved in cell wall biosynthesis